MPTPPKPHTITPHLLVLGVLGVVGIVAMTRVLERVIEKLGDTIEQVAAATGTAIGTSVQTAYTPVDDLTPPHPRARFVDDEGEAYPAPAWDPTYDYIPPETEDRLAIIPPGTSLIPGED
jgi:hypothetical protein